MNCTQCGTAIPAQSQFCLRCGTPVSAANRTAASRTTLPGQSPDRSGNFQVSTLSGHPARPANQSKFPRALLLALLIIGVGLLGAVAAVVHSRNSIASGMAGGSASGAVAGAEAPASPGGAVANGQAGPGQPGSVANAQSPNPDAGSVANAQAPGPDSGSVANQPTAPGPQQANDDENVEAYLRALARIEAERQEVNQRIDAATSDTAQQATGSQHVTDPQATMSRLLATEIASVGDDDKPDPLQSFVDKLMPVVGDVALAHVRLVGEIDSLQQVPGVPASCRDLQGYYRAAVTPFVTLANADRKNPLQFLQKAMQAQADEKNRLVEAEQALAQVFRTHPNVHFSFAIKNTEDTGDGGGIMSAPYVPGQ